MGIQIEIKGTEKVKEFLKNTSEEALKKANDAIIKAGFFIQAEVQASISGHRAEPKSVDTGRFLNSVKASQKQLLTASVETNVEYAKHLEYGTVKISPRYHFTNSAKRNEKNVREFVVSKIKDIG